MTQTLHDRLRAFHIGFLFTGPSRFTHPTTTNIYPATIKHSPPHPERIHNQPAQPLIAAVPINPALPIQVRL